MLFYALLQACFGLTWTERCFSYYRENSLAPTLHKLFPSFANFSGSLRELASSAGELGSSKGILRHTIQKQWHLAMEHCLFVSVSSVVVWCPPLLTLVSSRNSHDHSFVLILMVLHYLKKSFITVLWNIHLIPFYMLFTYLWKLTHISSLKSPFMLGKSSHFLMVFL